MLAFTLGMLTMLGLLLAGWWALRWYAGRSLRAALRVAAEERWALLQIQAVVREARAQMRRAALDRRT